MTSNVASRIVEALEAADTNAVNKHLNALEIQTPDVRAKVFQVVVVVVVVYFPSHIQAYLSTGNTHVYKLYT